MQQKDTAKLHEAHELRYDKLRPREFAQQSEWP